MILMENKFESVAGVFIITCNIYPVETVFMANTAFEFIFIMQMAASP